MSGVVLLHPPGGRGGGPATHEPFDSGADASCEALRASGSRREGRAPLDARPTMDDLNVSAAATAGHPGRAAAGRPAQSEMAGLLPGTAANESVALLERAARRARRINAARDLGVAAIIAAIVGLLLSVGGGHR